MQAILERDSLPRFAKRAFSGSLTKVKKRSMVVAKSSSSSELLSFPPLSTKPKSEQPEEEVHTGVLRRKMGLLAGWKPFLYVLRGTTLFEYKEDATPKKDNPLRVLRLKNAVVKGADEDSRAGKHHTFGIFAEKDSNTIVFRAQSEEDKTQWMATITANLHADLSPPSPPGEDDLSNTGGVPSNVHADGGSSPADP